MGMAALLRHTALLPCHILRLAFFFFFCFFRSLSRFLVRPIVWFALWRSPAFSCCTVEPCNSLGLSCDRAALQTHFSHIPKTGGTQLAVEADLKGNSNTHDHGFSRPGSAFLYGIVRNPLDKMRSWYTYLMNVEWMELSEHPQVEWAKRL